jgi:4-aminobutyrate aminotransferase / (S)-3-amino-2-methylpropionate transaminase / 5-aminovalerate transaminase
MTLTKSGRTRGVAGGSPPAMNQRVAGGSPPAMKKGSPPAMSSDEVRQLRDQYVPKGLHVGTPVVVARASGAEVFDPEGKRYLDFVAGIGALNLGHQHPEIIAAVREQLDRYAHVAAQVVTYEPYVRLAQELDRIYPRAEGSSIKTKSVFANSGAEAVENAIKIARVATGREWIIAFQNSFHGRTYTAMTATGKTKNSRMAFMRSTTPNIAHLPYPYPYRPIANVSEEELAELHVRLFEQALETNLAPEHVAAVIIEPVQGEAGFIPVPPRFLVRLRELCDTHGMVFIADEVQCGLGRTGRLFAVEHYDIVPDLVVTAKSLGAGMPIAAVSGRAEIMDAAHLGGIGGTFGGSPVACAAAIEALNIIRQPAFLAHARRLGDVMREVMNEWKARWPMVGDVRGLGPMMLAEFVRDRRTKEPSSPDETLQIVRQAVANGVVVMRAGLSSNCVRLLPPLTMPEDMLREGLNAIGSAIETVSQRLAAPSA